MTSLTHDAAVARARVVSVLSYDIALDLTRDGQYFGCVTTVRFARRVPGAGTSVDIAPHELHSARLNGHPLDVGTAFDPVTNRLELTALDEHNELVVDASMAYSHDGEGLHRHVDPLDGRTYLYAMSFLDAAPRWFACFDQPDLKARVSLDVRCPEEWTVSGNGPAHRIGPGHWQLRSAGPLATYFTTVVAGPYYRVHDVHDGVELVLSVRQSLAPYLDRDAAAIFAHTKHCLDRLHELFGVRYPWGEYHQAFVPEFNAGAMENPGCVTLRDQFVFRGRATDADLADRAVTIAHEMAHMWFGDLVTMRWWDDLWLNESFAEYLGQRIGGEHTWTAFGIARKGWGYAADRRPSTHPVAGNGAADAQAALNDFDGISYAKGASVLRQLAAHLGDDVFLGGLRDYIRRHAHANAEFADLRAAWAGAGATDLDAWMHAWLRTSGLDTLAIADGQLVRSSPTGTPRPHTVSVASFDAAGRELRRGRRRLDTERVAVDAVTGAALVLPDAADDTWAKIELPAATWARMPALLPRITDDRARVVVWNALRLAVADAEVDPALAVHIAVAALPRESDDAIGRIGRWAVHDVTGRLLADASRAAALRRITAAMLATADAAAPGGGPQLAAVRLAILATTDASWLQEWLAGRHLPTGVVLDTELRWSVLTRLAALGALDDAGIDREAAADASSAGAVHAARCRAALPEAVAKDAAWTTLMTDADRPNYELYALAEGFWQPHQAGLLAPYAQRYFAEIAATATLRSGWVVERVAALAYPWPMVSEATLRTTEELLARADLPTGLRRAVVDAGDDLRRAVTVRTRFG